MADIRDQYGNPIQLTDEHGNPVQLTDEHGHPMHLTGVPPQKSMMNQIEIPLKELLLVLLLVLVVQKSTISSWINRSSNMSSRFLGPAAPALAR